MRTKLPSLSEFNSSKLGKTLDYIDLGADVASITGIPIVSQVGTVVGTVSGIPQAVIGANDYIQSAKSGNYKPTLDQIVAVSKIIPTGGLWAKAGRKAWLAKDSFLKGPLAKKILSKWIPDSLNLGADTWEIVKNEQGGILKAQHGEITPAIVTQDPEFNKFLMTLPDNLRLTPEEDYYMYKSWKMNGRPRNFEEGLAAGMYKWDSSDNSYHGVTVIGYDENGIGHFGKPKHHDTVHYELDWYNKGLETLDGGEQRPLQGEDRKFWENFRKEYQLDSTGVDYRYVPRKKQGGKLPFYLKYFNYEPNINNKR